MSIRSILLVKTSSLGDVVHNLPVASDLARRWPGVAIDWVVEESFAEIPALHRNVRRVIPVAVRRWRKNLGARSSWQQMRQFAATLRSECYDVVLDTQGLIKSAVVTRLADGLRCGYSREVAREPLAALAYDCRYVIPTTAHAVERNRWLAAAACGYEIDVPLNYGLRVSKPGPDWQPSNSFAVLLTATSRADKQWSYDKWISLGHALASRGILSVLPAGSAQERTRAQTIATAIPGSFVAPQATISELAAVMRDAKAVVGVDTGLTHLAVALQRPTVAIYVATNPQLTGVFGAADAINLGGIGQSPECAAVLAALDKIIR